MRTSLQCDIDLRTLAKLFRQVGAVVHIEPRIYGSERLRPDMDITFPDRTLMLDVAVTHPASPSRTSSTPLAAAAYTEKAKYTKYTALAARQAATFLPFVLESYGAFGKRANEVLRILRKAAKNTLLALSSELSGLFRCSRSEDTLCGPAEGQRPHRASRCDHGQSCGRTAVIPQFSFSQIWTLCCFPSSQQFYSSAFKCARQFRDQDFSCVF